MKNFFTKTVKFLERFIPMTLWSLFQFIFVIYLIFVVGKTVIANYNSNKDIEKQDLKVLELQKQIHDLENEINYYQTYSFKEKEARAKLGYKAPGENILSLPIDTEEEKVADGGLAEPKIKIPNYRLWWQYFFE